MIGAETRFLLDIVLLFAIAGVCSIVLVRLKLPAIFGYLAAGIVLGPTMLPDVWVEQSTIDMLASFGIVLLMFYIGMELNLRELKKIGSTTIVVLTLEMSLIVLIGYFVGIMIGLDPIAAIFFGAIISGSSTAVVVGVLKSIGHLDAGTARAVIAITVLEDIGQVIILTLAAPLLVGASPTLGSALSMIVVIVIFISVSILMGATLIPRLLDWVGRRYTGEILLIVAVALCFTMALISSSIGLSIAIGSFLMGTIVSQSHYSETIKGKIEPMKELFMAVFFISIGIQVYPSMIINSIPLVLIIAATFIFAKSFSVSVACYLTNFDIRTSFKIGMSLVAMGEFAFIVAKTANDAGLVTQEFYSSVIGAALITMFVLPLLSRYSDRLLDRSISLVPASVRQIFWKVEEMKSGVRQKAEASVALRKQLRNEFLLILVDVVVIISVQLVINLLLMSGRGLNYIAEGLHVVPLVVLYLLGLVLITPAVFNTLMGIKRIAAIMDQNSMAAGGEQKEGGGFAYGLVKNVGYVLLGGVLVLLFLPFFSLMGPGLLTTLVFLLMTWLVVLFFIWRSYKSAYDKLNQVISRNVLDQGKAE